MVRSRNIVREVVGLACTTVGALAVIALATLLISRGEWVAGALLGVGVQMLAVGVALGRYDPDAAQRRRTPRPAARPDAIEMVPRVRDGGGDAPTP